MFPFDDVIMISQYIAKYFKYAGPVFGDDEDNIHNAGLYEVAASVCKVKPWENMNPNLRNMAHLRPNMRNKCSKQQIESANKNI